MLLDEIARGGMGIIYRATDTVLDREVAVKLLQERFDEPSGVERRFLDEARITGQLQHPGIPAVHDLGTLPDGRPFLAMKLVKGNTLDRLLKQRSSPAEERGRFVAVFEQICQAVGYAHAHNVIHRDLKPANVMVGAFGEVQVMDWGLAKVLDARTVSPAHDPDETTGTAIRSLRDSEAATQAGSVLGTLAFMPPEQALGAIGKIDVRSDVFGLGAILAVILTGKPPFEAGSVETLRIQAAQGKLDGCFARLDACGADPELVALCKGCLSPDKADRPPDGGAVARAVAQLRAAADERAREAELERVRAEGERARAEAQRREQRKRRRVQLALAAAVFGLVAVAAFGVVLAIFWQRAEGEKAAAESARDGEQKARKEAEKARAAEQEAREKFERSEYGRTMQVAYQEWRDNNVPAALALLGDTRPELRGWEWDYVHRLCHADLLTLKGHGSGVESASFSPDGTRIVTASQDQTAKVWDARTGAETLSLKHTAKVQSAMFSPDGTRIVTASADRTAKVWDARSGTETFTLKGDGVGVGSATFSPDGTRIVTTSADQTAKVWDARPLHPERRLDWGDALLAQGDLDGACAEYRAATRSYLDPRHPAARAFLLRTEQLREMLSRLPDIVAGQAEPKSPAEACAFANLCGQPSQKRYADAVRLFEKAFAAEPKLAEDLLAFHRYNAACYAALAAHGDGLGAATELKERIALRAHALAWLQADLALWKDKAASKEWQDRQRAASQLAHWEADADLVETRPGAKRAGWTEQESKAWDQLWSEVRQTLAQAQKP